MSRSMKFISFLLIFTLLALIPKSIYSNKQTPANYKVKESSNDFQFNLTPEANMISLVEYSRFDDDGVNEKALGVAIKDDLAFIANYDQGLEIINISDPINPRKISSIDIISNAIEVLIKDNIAIVASENYGVVFVDVANPNSPTIIMNLDLEDSVKEFGIRFNLLHILTEDNGLLIYDISNPAQPLHISDWNSGYRHTGISVLNKLICLSGTTVGLEIIDLTFYSNPTFLGSWNDSTGDALGVFATEINNKTYAFLANDNSGLEIIDFTDVKDPVKIGEYNGLSNVVDVVVENDTAYLCSDSGIAILNVSDPSSPVELDVYTSDGECKDIFIKEEIAIIADFNNGIDILDISNPYDIQLFSEFFDNGGAKKLTIKDDLAFIADGPAGLEIFNLSNPYQPTKIGQYSEPLVSSTDIMIQDDIAVLSVFGDGVFFLNISDPTNPIKINSYYDGNRIQTAYISNDLVFLGSRNQSLVVLNISDLSSISIAGSYDFSIEFSFTYDLFLDNDTLIVASFFEGVTLLNISDLSNIQKLANYDTGLGSQDLFLEDNILYTVSRIPGLEILSYNQTYVDLVSHHDVSGFNAVDIEKADNIVYIADENQGIFIVDVSNISNPVTVGEHRKYDIYDLHPYDQYLVACANNDGIIIFTFDSDSDGITDIDERDIWGTDPFNADTDGDEIDDYFEIMNGLDPLDPSDRDEDPDQDGLTNFEEYFWMREIYSGSTDPQNPDTDFDGMPDGYEHENSLEPLIANGEFDADFDYLTNLEEYLLGTDPRNSDTDGDGAEDGLEVLYNTDPFDPKDYPAKKRIIRLSISLVFIIGFLVASVTLFVRYIRRRIARNIEREKGILEAEDEILLF
ncbi:MAG: hypothetical protein JJE41_10240 [Candidatus Heimdallarchaeota archaeon]|nr:hypothetical protein [Candidatus Heimdallarchaeota archaeon]